MKGYEPFEGDIRRERGEQRQQLHVNLRGAVQFSIGEQLLRRIVKRFREGLVFKAHRLLCQTTLGSTAIKKERRSPRAFEARSVSSFPSTCVRRQVTSPSRKRERTGYEPFERNIRRVRGEECQQLHMHLRGAHAWGLKFTGPNPLDNRDD